MWSPGYLLKPRLSVSSLNLASPTDVLSPALGDKQNLKTSGPWTIVFPSGKPGYPTYLKGGLCRLTHVPSSDLRSNV